ncbi:MAG: DMT family transporter [Candidatus Eiseniibacteriota bacterium]
MPAASVREIAGPKAGARLRAVMAMVLATLLWGGTFLVTRDALPHVGVAALLLARFGGATLLLSAALFARRRRFTRETLLPGLACGPFIALCCVLQTGGLRETSAGSSAFLTCAGTLSAPFFAWAMIRERPSAAVFAGMALALVGSALLSWRPELGVGRAELLTFLGAMAYAFQLVIVARVAPRVDVLALTAAQLLGVTLCLLPFADLRSAAALFAAPALGWRVLYLTLGGTVIAPLLQVDAQRTLPTGRIALLFALEPVFALVIAALFGGERFLAQWWVGAALILCAMLVAEWTSAR